MVQRHLDGEWTVEWTFRRCAEADSDLYATLEASQRFGGRFNVKGQFGAIYVAGGAETAVAELGRIVQKQGLTRRDLTPRLLLMLELSVRRVLDLTSVETQQEWGLTDAD